MRVFFTKSTKPESLTFNQSGFVLIGGGHQCSACEAGAVLMTTQQAERVSGTGKPLLIRIRRPSSRCAPWQTEFRAVHHARAASLLHAAAFGLRASLAGDQWGGG